ncbi:MAG: MBL fold metallo-hydrolase, partial [Pseudomonadota bacterium]
MTLRLTILGCGSSGGVPRLGGHWGACDPNNPKNRRQRCSLLVEQITNDGTTRVLIDTGPDMRNQLLQAGVGTLDGVVYTHPHADHIHGLDDLRMIVFNMKKRLSVWADAPTRKDLEDRFAYAFIQPEWSTYPPILDMNDIDGPFEITGAGGAIPFAPFRVPHGGITSLGFRIHDAVYLPDVEDLADDSRDHLQDLDLWIVDALRYTPHPTHAHLDRTLGWIAEMTPKQAVITNMHIDIDYHTLKDALPTGVV